MRGRSVVWLAVPLILCVGLAAAAQEYAAQHARDCVVIILDGSGSMDAQMPGGIKKIDAAKQALRTVLTQVPETTQIGLLVFSTRGISQPWVYPLGPRHDEVLLKAIDAPQPGGSTPLGKFIKMGADRLLEERAKQYGYGSYRLLVVTDGEATDGTLTQEYTPDIIARGITVDVIGVNMAQDHTLATQVHSYRRADDPRALEKALSEILAEVNASDGAAAAEDFELLAPLPAELCASMIQALAKTNNQPIQKSALAVAQGRDAAAGRRLRQVQQPVPTPPQPVSGHKEFSFGTVIVVAVVFLAIMQAIKNKARR